MIKTLLALSLPLAIAIAGCNRDKVETPSTVTPGSIPARGEGEPERNGAYGTGSPGVTSPTSPTTAPNPLHPGTNVNPGTTGTGVPGSMGRDGMNNDSMRTRDNLGTGTAPMGTGTNAPGATGSGTKGIVPTGPTGMGPTGSGTSGTGTTGTESGEPATGSTASKLRKKAAQIEEEAKKETKDAARQIDEAIKQ